MFDHRSALVLVDIQRDFLPGGSLAVPDGDAVVPVANRVQPLFEIVVATQDWHPPDHASFAAEHPGRQVGETIAWDGLDQRLWPIHCVQDSAGAEFAGGLETSRFRQVFQKGLDRDVDSYSGFFDNGRRRSTELAPTLRAWGVERVYLLGLALDVCVKFTALDAVELGFETCLIEDGARPVDAESGAAAIDEMRAAGVRIVSSRELEWQAADQ